MGQLYLMVKSDKSISRYWKKFHNIKRSEKNVKSPNHHNEPKTVKNDLSGDTGPDPFFNFLEKNYISNVKSNIQIYSSSGNLLFGSPEIGTKDKQMVS